MARLHLVASGDAPRGPSALQSLVTLNSEVLERENRRISAWLERDMANPEAHEQAAFLLGAFSLREAAGMFSDTRHELSRMAAHLALAGALRGSRPPSLEGEYARPLLSTLAGRQREAVEWLARLRSKKGLGSAEKVWINALNMRNTGDWRALAKPDKASLLERLEHFRALRRTQGEDAALNSVGHAEVLSDWGRVLLEGDALLEGAGFSVGVGNAFTVSAVALEIGDLSNAWGDVSQESPERLVSRLNERPGRCIGAGESGQAVPHVIDRGTWASSSQRHLLHSMQSTELHLLHLLGLRDEADAYRTTMDERLGGLTLYPLLGQYWFGPFKQPPARWDRRCEAAVRLLHERPESVTAFNWSIVGQRCPSARKDGTWLEPSFWFDPALPTGTAFDSRRRLLTLLRLQTRRIEEVRERAPYDSALIRWIIAQKYGMKPTSKQVAEAWGPLADYVSEARDQIMRSQEAEGAAPSGERQRLCESDPNTCLAYGGVLAQRGQDDAAAAAYERAFAGARDQVSVSSVGLWLANYYLDRGEVARALKVARAAADVYSNTGLLSMARMMERTDRHDEAEAWYLKLAERYPGDRSLLLSFYIRRGTGDGRFSEKATKALAELFPKGLERVTLGDLKDPPAPPENVGISLSFVPWALDRLGRTGVREDDMIMAIDGYRVRNPDQLACVISLSEAPEATVIAWRGDRFLELKGPIERPKVSPPRSSAKVSPNREPPRRPSQHVAAPRVTEKLPIVPLPRVT